MDSDCRKALRELDNTIQGITRKEYLPADLVTLVQRVQALHIRSCAEAQVVLPPETDFAPPDLRAQGAPLLERSRFPLDRGQAEKLFHTLLGLLAEMPSPLPDAARFLESALVSGELSLQEALDAYLNDDQDFFSAWSERTADAPSVLRFLVQAASSPGIEAAAKVLAANVPDKVWKWGHCPVCGSLPFMADLKDKEGFRFLSCSFCRTRYRVKRIACPYCGEEDFDKLSFFTAKEEPGFRVDVCRSCKLYIKTTDFRQLDRKSSPLLDDLDSLVMDIMAADKGFVRPTPSGWGF